MVVLVAVILCTLLYGGLASAATAHTHHEVLDENGDFTLSWKFDDVNIEFEAQAKTRGWLGLGLSPNGGMPGSDIVIGWVKDGQAHLTDRYADEKAQPPVDESQDWELLSGYENDTHTVLRFKRKLQTCDDRDRTINRDTLRVLWAWNDQDPDDSTGPVYHGENRGVRSSIFIRNHVNAEDESLPNDILSYDLVMTNTTIPSTRTNYWCKVVDMPRLQTKHHIFKIQPVVTPGNEGMVHHILAYKCHINPNRTVASHEHPGHGCYTPNMPQDWMECYQGSIIVAWAVGTGDISFPSHVGYPIGDEEDSGQVLLEIHYDNPLLREGVEDTSGLKFLYTPELRQHDAGVLVATQQVGFSQIVPPHAVDFKTEAFCNQECLGAFIDEVGEQIHLFGNLPHAHLLARKMRTSLIRDGVETVITRDDNYDFNLQSIRLFDEEVTVQKGDTIVTECTYNSAHKSETVYGGLGTENEMCESILFYYPKIKMIFCDSQPHPLSILSFAGVEEINMEDPNWNGWVGAIPITKPDSMSNMTYLDVVESIVWDQDKAQQFSQHLREGRFVADCGFGGMETFGTSQYRKESDFPRPRVPAAEPEDICSTSKGTVGTEPFIMVTLLSVLTYAVLCTL